MAEYKHLTEKDREIIFILKRKGWKQIKIADQLKVHPGTVSREIKRNSSVINIRFNNHPKKEKYKQYLPDKAHQKSKKRRYESKTPFPLKTPKLYKYVINKLKEGWSPDSIAGKARKDNIGCISHECIYQFIYSEKGKELELYQYLRRAHRKRRKWKGRKGKRHLIPNRLDINLRPKEVEKRKRFGHWEGDSILGVGKKSALHTEVERVSRYLIIRKIKRKTAEQTAKAMIDIFKNVPRKLRKTSTLDNGSEFVKHEEVTSNTNIKIFFAQPYHSWERGSNEHANGLIRWYLPKGTNFDEITDRQIEAIQYAINTRPRKSLNYSTPYEIFRNQLNK